MMSISFDTNTPRRRHHNRSECALFHLYHSFIICSFVIFFVSNIHAMLLSTYDGTFECITLMSKNVLSNGPQTPIPDTSRREFSALFPFLIRLFSSGMSWGLILTSPHTSCISSASRFLHCVSSSRTRHFCLRGHDQCRS